jgi:HEAT repeat protein
MSVASCIAVFLATSVGCSPPPQTDHTGDALGEERALLARLLTERDDRVGIAESFGGLDREAQERAGRELEELLSSPDWEIRYFAALALAAIGPPAASAVPRLATLAASDESAGVRHFAVAALGNIGPAAEAATPVLIELLDQLLAEVETDTDEGIAAEVMGGRLRIPLVMQILYALGEIGRPREPVLSALNRALESDFEPFHRAAESVIQMLKHTGDEG